MRSSIAGRTFLGVWLSVLGALACDDPSGPPSRPVSASEPRPSATRRLPAGFFELWPGGPVGLDRGRARALVAALARERWSVLVRPRGVAGPSLTVVETSFQEELSGSSAAKDGPWAYVVDWSDGGATTQGTRTATGPIPVSRTYKQSGTYAIGVTVRDKDGGSASATFPLVVLKRNGRPR